MAETEPQMLRVNIHSTAAKSPLTPFEKGGNDRVDSKRESI
jgi:hypothetical protein